MIKMIVCDDIPVIRNNIVSLLKEHRPEYNVCGIYFDGQQVIDHLEKEPVDLIITDIKMKKITGIDILKYVNEHKMKTRIILITAYAEFNYAIDAVNYHAAKFITKPINPNDFLQAVDEVLKDIVPHDKQSNDRQLHITNLLLSHNEMQRRLEGLYQNRIGFDEFKNYCESSNRSYLSRYLFLVNITIKNHNAAKTFSWYDIAECYNTELDSYIVSQDSQMCTLLVFVNHTEDGIRHLEHWLTQVKKTFSVFYRTSVSSTANRFENISYLYGDNKNVAEHYINCIENNDYEGKIKFEREVIERYTLKDELNLISYLCNRYSIPDLESQNVQSATKEDANEFFLLLTEKINKHLANDYKKVLFKKIERYLEENFGDPLLSLNSVASSFNFSPSYLSKLFHEYNGISFTSRLTELRMNHAKKLLKNPKIPIKDIAAECGYNKKYFSKLFTKKFGINPRLYRNRSI